MMMQPILDMQAIAAQERTTEDHSQSFLDKLMNSLAKATEASDAALSEDLLDRAASYADSQPSFAADLRAAVTREEALAVA